MNSEKERKMLRKPELKMTEEFLERDSIKIAGQKRSMTKRIGNTKLPFAPTGIEC